MGFFLFFFIEGLCWLWDSKSIQRLMNHKSHSQLHILFFHFIIRYPFHSGGSLLHCLFLWGLKKKRYFFWLFSPNFWKKSTNFYLFVLSFLLIFWYPVCLLTWWVLFMFENSRNGWSKKSNLYLFFSVFISCVCSSEREKKRGSLHNYCQIV